MELNVLPPSKLFNSVQFVLDPSASDTCLQCSRTVSNETYHPWCDWCYKGFIVFDFIRYNDRCGSGNLYHVGAGIAWYEIAYKDDVCIFIGC